MLSPTFSEASWPGSPVFFWASCWLTCGFCFLAKNDGARMKVEVNAKLVTIFVNSTDHWHGVALYSAIVQLCQERGIAGASVTRCVEGYGSGHQLHTARLLELSENLPVRIEVVDLPERIEPLLAALESMIGEGLVTVQNVHIMKYIADPRPST